MPYRHPILFSFRRCPYAIRARMALYQSGVTVELREILLKDKPDEMLDLSPKGTVPVLVLSDGTVIDESLDIMFWALQQKDHEHWLDFDLHKIETLIDKNDNKFKRALDRFKYPNRYPDEDCSWARDACEETFMDLDSRLKNHNYLLGDSISVADVAIFPFIRQCAHVDNNWFNDLPIKNLHHWLKGFLDHKVFKSVFTKVSVWSPGDTPIYLAAL
jgi:glutathione S-transferase